MIPANKTHVLHHVRIFASIELNFPQRLSALACLLHEQTAQLAASLQEGFQRGSGVLRAELDAQALQMNAVTGDGFNMVVVQELHSEEIDDAEVGHVALQLCDLDCLVNFFFFLRHFFVRP